MDDKESRLAELNKRFEDIINQIESMPTGVFRAELIRELISIYHLITLISNDK